MSRFLLSAWLTADDPLFLFSASGRPLLILAGLIPVAVVVFWYGSSRFRREHGLQTLRPKGRMLGLGGVRRRSASWRAVVGRLEQRPPTPIADATAGPIRIEGVIMGASETLGGSPECVWRNRAGARPDSAIGASLVMIADDSGTCGLEGLEQARVVSPTERITTHRETISLYIGDRVEVFAHFEPERVAEGAQDPREIVYGTLAARGGLDVRLVRRPSEPATHG